MKHLWRALDLKLSEVLQIDLLIGVLGGVASVVLALTAPQALARAVAVGPEAIGTVVGAVVAGVAVQVAFFDQAFLRKLRLIDRNPVDYLAPFIFTAVLGVASLLLLFVMAALGPEAPAAVLAVVGGLCGLVVWWTIGSLLPGLATLVQFIGLKMDALDVPD